MPDGYMGFWRAGASLVDDEWDIGLKLVTLLVQATHRYSYISSNVVKVR